MDNVWPCQVNSMTFVCQMSQRFNLNLEKDRGEALKFLDSISSDETVPESENKTIEDILQECDHRTDSYQEGETVSENESSSDDDRPLSDLLSRWRVYTGRDNITKWKKVGVAERARPKGHDIIKEISGPKAVVKHFKNPLKIWSYLITPAMITLIMDYTNIYTAKISERVEDSNTYRIYDPIEDVILKSRDVIFLEGVTNDVQVTSEYNNSSNEFIIFTDDEQKLKTVQENSPNLIEIESSEIQDNWATTDEEYKPEKPAQGISRKSNRKPKPKVFEDFVSYNAIDQELNDLSSVKILSESDKQLWIYVMQEEYDSLIENETWVLCDLPMRYNSLRYVFALAAKYDLDIDQMDAVTAFLSMILI
ncbi:hypothetical protein QE152_g22663 [Popillia japonica]|uniref:Uncharacterized protein n=1 Tax=Popillia japonica TaxID=7064 RepID=A0AAW1KI87_POPJA